MQIVWGVWKGCWHHARLRDAQRGNNRYRPVVVVANSLPTSNSNAHAVHTLSSLPHLPLPHLCSTHPVPHLEQQRPLPRALVELLCHAVARPPDLDCRGVARHEGGGYCMNTVMLRPGLPIDLLLTWPVRSGCCPTWPLSPPL